MKLSKSIRNLAFGLVTVFFGAQASAGIVVVVNPNSGISSLSAGQAKAIFLGKQSSFPNGGKAVPVDQPEDSAIRNTFANKVLGKSGSQLKAYWSKMIFSGKGSPPQAVVDNAAVKAFVAGTPGGIGYIDGDQVDGSVTVVLTAN